MRHYFITATDTDAGKTYFSRVLVNALKKQNFQVAVYKPIAAGCYLQNGQLVNEDALLLQQASNAGQTYPEINPIAFAEPIAPHIAAKLTGQPINTDIIMSGFQQLNADINIIEGAGGWRLPLGNGVFFSDLVKQMKIPVILVVNMKLGCLNHAVLTYQSILNDGLTCAGWVANCQQSDMPYLNENINELKSLIAAPCLAVLGYESDINQVQIDTGVLLKQ